MKRHTSLAALLALAGAAATAACGLGGSADLGDDQDAINDTGDGDGSGGQAQTGNGGSASGESSAGAGSGGTPAGEGGQANSSGGEGNPPEAPTQCGDTTCAVGEICCNASCGICTPPGGACIQVACDDPGPDCSGAGANCATGFAWSVAECGCVPATPCGDSFCTGGATCCDGACVAGSCDAAPDGGVDCSGALALCVAGTVWSVEDCSCVPEPPKGEPCGPSLCTGTKVCCNDSCGTCAEPTDACTDELCAPPPAGSCTDDSDCTLVDNYCGGCHCLSLSDPNQAPVCSDPVVCFAEACLTAKGAACVAGTCVVVY